MDDIRAQIFTIFFAGMPIIMFFVAVLVFWGFIKTAFLITGIETGYLIYLMDFSNKETNKEPDNESDK